MLAGILAAALSDPLVSIANITFSTVRIGADTTAHYELQSDGDVERSGATHGSTTDAGDWVSPKTAAGANYECRVTVNSGTLTSGTEDTWLALSSTRTWSVTTSGAGTNNVNMTVEIRHAGTTAVLDSATIDMTAEHAV